MPSPKSKFQPGDRAPQFSLPYDELSQFSLDAHLGRGPILVAFIRGTWCPFCRKFLQRLLKSWDSIQTLGCEVVIVASQPLSQVVRFSKQEKLPFRILSDGDRKVARLYGIFPAVGLMGMTLACPSVFLLDDAGRIAYQHIGTVTHRASVSEILLQLERIPRQGKPLGGVRSMASV